LPDSNGKGQIVDLDLGRAVSALELPDMPHLSSGISWRHQLEISGPIDYGVAQHQGQKIGQKIGNYDEYQIV